MLDSQQKFTGTRYTGTVALFILAIVFVPAVLIISSPVGADSIALAAICSASCLGFGWRNWKKHSRLTIPSLEILSRPIERLRYASLW